MEAFHSQCGGPTRGQLSLGDKSMDLDEAEREKNLDRESGEEPKS